MKCEEYLLISCIYLFVVDHRMLKMKQHFDMYSQCVGW